MQIGLKQSGTDNSKITEYLILEIKLCFYDICNSTFQDQCPVKEYHWQGLDNR